MDKNIAKVVVDVPVEGPFDYRIDSSQKDCIQIGMRVRVMFNRRKMVGYVVGFAQKSEFDQLNSIIGLLEDEPVCSPAVLTWTKKIAEYYGCSWGEAIAISLPRHLRQDRFIKYNCSKINIIEKESIPQNDLLVGVATEESWAHIVQLIDQEIKQHRSVIILTPEKFNVPEILKKLSHLPTQNIFPVENKLKVKEEVEQFCQIKQTSPSIVIGTRSAVFAPCQNLGRIIVLNEDNELYHEEQHPYYWVQQIARFRAEAEKCALTFVSGAPTVEAWEKAKKEKWAIKEFKDDSEVNVHLVDMENYNPRKTSILSFPLQNALNKNLEEGKKSIIFFNRRGFNTFTKCNECGYTVKCDRCDSPLVLMHATQKLVCTKCHFQRDLMKKCPSCKGDYLRSMGRGIEKLESQVCQFFPQAKISIYDKDSKSFPKHADIILATSAVFRKLGKIKADLVAILQFDQELNRMDYRSAHKALSLLMNLKQLSKEKLFVQTHMRDNYCLEAFIKQDIPSFYQNEMKHRKELDLPPYKKLFAVALRSAQEEQLIKIANKVYDRLATPEDQNIEVIEPFPDVNPKLRDKYRYTIMLKGQKSKSLLAHTKVALKGFRKPKEVIMTLHMDP